MATDRKLITAAELDARTPDERSMMVRSRTVKDLNELPEEFRRRVETTAARLAEDLVHPDPE